MLPHLIVDFLVPEIGFRAEAGGLQSAGDLLAVPVGIGGDRGDHHLHRRQPEREAPGMLLDEDGEETLEGAENRPVQHDRTVLLAVLANIAGAEPLRQHAVDKEDAALPVAAEGYEHNETKLPPLERAR